MENPVDVALRIAVSAHAGTLDKGGVPYILHPLAVGLAGNTEDEKITGFLHDVVEDTDWTFDRLLAEGIPSHIVEALRLLTHDKAKVSYEEYIQVIIDSGNPIAIHVKFNDLTHNYNRSGGNPGLRAKYEPALKKMTAAVEAVSRVSLYKSSEGLEHAVFACGCFWGVQYQFSKQKGVVSCRAGYTGGAEKFPSYEDVRAHRTGHVEAVVVEYSPSEVSYRDLCRLFFEIHDPAQTDGVGPDIGPQYRSCIFD